MTDNFMIDIEDRTHDEILKAINDAGYTIGVNSLKLLLNGSSFQAGMFEIIDVRFVPKKNEDQQQQQQQQPKAVVVAPSIPEPIQATTATIETKKVDIPVPAPVVVEQKPELLVEVMTKKPIVQLETIKQPTKAPKQKVDKVVAVPSSPAPESVLEGTKNAKLFEMLARPEGASREEIMKEFDWSPSCLASIIYTVPKSKGYAIFAEKADNNKLCYHLYFVGGAGKVLPEQVVYRIRKGVSMKGKKAAVDKEEATPQPAAPRVTISKENMRSVPTHIELMAAKMSQHFHPR